MANKILITQKQAMQFNIMLGALKLIYKDYETPEKLRKKSEQNYGLYYEEALEMAYGNIQDEARQTIKGIKPLVLNLVTTKP